MAAQHDDLQDLLDSALDDLHNVECGKSIQGLSGKSTSSEVLPADHDACQSGSSLGKGLGVSLPVLPPVKKRTGSSKGKSSAPLKLAESKDDSGSNGNFSDTLEKLAKQTRETLEGMDVGEDGLDDKLVESLVKQFEELGGSEDIQSIVDTMVKSLLSKEVLYEPMKELAGRYPKWLEVNAPKLSKEDFRRYLRQSELTKELCHAYDTSPEDIQKIVDIMQKMQDCGQPPNDLLQELSPGLELNEDGLPLLSQLLEGDSGLGQNCSIM